MKRFIKNVLLNVLIVMVVLIPLSKVNAETRNNNPLLIELSIDGNSNAVAFDQFITDYVIATDKENIEIEAVPDDPNASVEIIGSSKLNVGKNDIEIRVTAEDQKTTKSYYLHVTRGETKKANANLKKLEIENIELNPEFNSKDINYYIEYEGIIKELKITATPEDKNAKVEIVGNSNFDTGTNHIVKITVTAEDGITTKTYQIVAKKAGEHEEDLEGIKDFENELAQQQEKTEISNQKEEKKTVYNIAITICALIIIAAIIALIFKKRSS